MEQASILSELAFLGFVVNSKLSKYTVVRDLELPLSLHPCPPAVILVASAGHDADQIAALELVSSVKSADKVAASIFLKPFCFEGQRRQVEASDSIAKLQACSNFHIVIEPDSLLETEVETLAEALDSANNTVLSTISMISIMMSGLNQMFWSSPNAQIKEVDPAEVGNLLKSYGEARVGFGAGYNIQSAIKQAVLHCPFLRGGIKIFRRVTGFAKDIVFSRNSEPDLEPKLIVISLLTVRHSRDETVASAKEGFLSNLALRFPFISSFMGDIPELSQLPDNRFSSAEPGRTHLSSAFTDSAALDLFFEEIENKKPESLSSESGRGISTDSDREDLISQEEHNLWSNAPAIGIAQLWAKEPTTAEGSNHKDELGVITLPVGVKPSEVQYNHSPSRQPESHNATYTTSAASGASISDVGLEKVMEMCSSAAAFLKGRFDKSRKRGSITSRAASMLDAEREPEKTWSPIVEIQFGEGTYRGICQEGVPEGKGRLTYNNGSFYDGHWKYGKRSGLVTFYYINGDVFHGTWRDDLIHGKGWYYFHSGDRWFANFWKGKANGEGRFYAKDGSIFFGHFQNGWRHGESLLIETNGSRWLEVWDDGLLINKTKLEK